MLIWGYSTDARLGIEIQKRWARAVLEQVASPRDSYVQEERGTPASNRLWRFAASPWLHAQVFLNLATGNVGPGDMALANVIPSGARDDIIYAGARYLAQETQLLHRNGIYYDYLRDLARFYAGSHRPEQAQRAVLRAEKTANEIAAASVGVLVGLCVVPALAFASPATIMLYVVRYEASRLLENALTAGVRILKQYVAERQRYADDRAAIADANFAQALSAGDLEQLNSVRRAHNRVERDKLVNRFLDAAISVLDVGGRLAASIAAGRVGGHAAQLARWAPQITSLCMIGVYAGHQAYVAFENISAAIKTQREVERTLHPPSPDCIQASRMRFEDAQGALTLARVLKRIDAKQPGRIRVRGPHGCGMTSLLRTIEAASDVPADFCDGDPFKLEHRVDNQAWSELVLLDNWAKEMDAGNTARFDAKFTRLAEQSLVIEAEAS